MKRASRPAAAHARIILLGAAYRLVPGGLLVTAEDYEIAGGHRTGRILVRAAEAGNNAPLRWYCQPFDLEEAEPAPTTSSARQRGNP